MDEDGIRELVAAQIREVPDFPSPGILFRDITPLLASPEAFAAAVDWLAERAEGADSILGIESRGFIFGMPAALRLGLPFAPARKAGKLPRATLGREYALEYGTARLEIHRDAFATGARVALVDDLLATGGTLEAAAELVGDAGASLHSISVILELAELGGRARLPSAAALHALIAC